MTRALPLGTRAQDHPLYRRWNNMRQVCYNPNCNDYAKVGGQGIKMSKEFEEFWNFVDLIETELGYPEDFGFHTKLARKCQKGDYTIKNMCWDTTRNVGRRHAKVTMLRYKGVTKSVRQWSEERNIKYATMLTRIHLGWRPAQVLGYELGPRYSLIARQQASK